MDQSCRILKISKSAYYRWAAGTLSPRTAENERIADLVENIHEKHPEMGYRRLKDELDRRHNTHENDKRMLRICRSRRIKSSIKYSNHGWRVLKKLCKPPKMDRIKVRRDNT